MAHWSILGAGAIGSLWACKLAEQGHEVTLVTRPDSKEKQREITLIEPGQQKSYRFNCVTQEPDDSEFLLVTLKAGQVVPALEQLQANCPLILMHNGMGTLEPLFEKMPQLPTLVATTSHGALRHADGSIEHTGFGRTMIGPTYMQHTPRALCAKAFEMMSQALPEVEYQQDMKPALWHKLAVNAVINPLTALNDCQNGELATQAHRDIVHSLVQELVQVAGSEGLDWQADELEQEILQVAQATANNWSSMHQDIQHGRTSEIDAITGYLLQRAKAHGLSLPAHQSLYDQIKARES